MKEIDEEINGNELASWRKLLWQFLHQWGQSKGQEDMVLAGAGAEG